MYICVHSKVLFIYLNIEENTISVEIVENESYLHNLLRPSFWELKNW